MTRRRTELTPQQQAIARLLIAGRTPEEIAAKLKLSLLTVKSHLRGLRSKLRGQEEEA